jgi:hypothetical protein
MESILWGSWRRPAQPIPRALFVIIAVIASALAGGCGGEMPSSPDGAAVPALATNLKQVAPASESAGKGRAVAAPRQIIYDARVELVVESLATAEQAVLNLIKEHDGLLAESDQASVTSAQRRATWRVRVPVDQFGPFLAAVSRLGEVKQSHVGSHDVTEEYVDIEARVRNKQEEEKRLLKHLSDSTGKLDDILTVERELSRVRGEVEQMQGRLRFLANRAELSTVTIEATERKNDQPPIEPAFPAQLARVFFGSVGNLVAFGQVLLLLVVALAPWLPLIVLAIFVARWVVKLAARPSKVAPN